MLFYAGHINFEMEIFMKTGNDFEYKRIGGIKRLRINNRKQMLSCAQDSVVPFKNCKMAFACTVNNHTKF